MISGVQKRDSHCTITNFDHDTNHKNSLLISFVDDPNVFKDCKIWVYIIYRVSNDTLKNRILSF